MVSRYLVQLHLALIRIQDLAIQSPVLKLQVTMYTSGAQEGKSKQTYRCCHLMPYLFKLGDFQT